jgi:CHAT domain-containing protein
VEFKHLILLLILTILGKDCFAQNSYINSLKKEKDRMLNAYLVNEINAKNAIKRMEFIHSEFRRYGLKNDALEENLQVGALYYFSGEIGTSFVKIKEGLGNVYEINDSLTFKYLNLLSQLYRQQSIIDSAEVYFRKGFNLISDKPILERVVPNEIVVFYNNYSYFLNRYGETGLRKEVMNRAYELAKKLEKKDYAGIIENQLADSFAANGNYKDAINYYNLSISNTRKVIYKVPRTLNLIQAYFQIENWKEVQNLLKIVEEDLKMMPQESKDYNIYKLDFALKKASWKTHLNQKDEAIVLVKNALKAIKINRDKRETMAYLFLANYSIRNQRLAYYNLAISSALIDRGINNLDLRNVLFPTVLTTALSQKAIFEQNPKTFESTVEFISELRKAFPFDETNFSFDNVSRPIIHAALELSNPENTFTYIEKAKAGILEEVVSHQDLKLNLVSKELINKEIRLNRELMDLRIEAISNSDSSSTIRNKINDKRIELAFTKKEMEQRYPEYFNLKYSSHTPSIRDVQSSLNPKQALISFFIFRSELYSSIITSEKASSKKVVVNEKFYDALKRLDKDLFQNPGLGSFTAISEAQILYQNLIKPIEEYITGRSQLIIVRDAELNRIPFEILIDDKGDFLLDTYAISYNHSASLFTNKKTNSQNSTILVFAPYANGAFQKTTFRDRNLGSLPFSTKEVENIKGITYKNQSATKNRFLQDYQKHGVIHFATHAQMDDTDPSKSFIAFYPDSSDYKLYTEELYNLSLKNTQLVVLSACEAGGGKLQKGEGLMSLARGFAYAGCPAVITTLWKANDESTAWLSERLHHYLNKGWNKSEALRQAKIDFRASDIGQEYDHPYFWANFILIGDDAPLQRTFWDEYKWWLIATFIVAIILILYLNLSKSSGQN